MTSPLADAVRGRIFRTSGRYRLVLYDRLAPEDRKALGALRGDPDFYGILNPAGGADHTVKGVDRETALLLFTLVEPGPLPEYALAAPDAEARTRAIAGLVLDGVLEMKAGGRFVCGADALPALRLGADERSESCTATGRLSRRAVRFAAHREAAGPGALQEVLYRYNRLPLSRRWRDELSDGAAVRRFLGVGPGGPCRARLAAGWSEVPVERAGGWLAWRSRRSDGVDRSAQPTFKLYLSPRTEALAASFESLLEVLATRDHEGFKVGADAAGLLRPDKLIVYFASLEDLAAAAEETHERLLEAPVQGVPFSAEIGSGGLTSWGMDPPAREAQERPGPRDSWRTWITGRLAAAIWSCRRDGNDAAAASRLALERLRLEGVDVERWTPSAKVWSAN